VAVRDFVLSHHAITSGLSVTGSYPQTSFWETKDESSERYYSQSPKKKMKAGK
jgi:hypothetical protein